MLELTFDGEFLAFSASKGTCKLSMIHFKLVFNIEKKHIAT